MAKQMLGRDETILVKPPIRIYLAISGMSEDEVLKKLATTAVGLDPDETMKELERKDLDATHTIMTCLLLPQKPVCKCCGQVVTK